MRRSSLAVVFLWGLWVSGCPQPETVDDTEPIDVPEEASCHTGLDGTEVTYEVSTLVPGHFMLKAEQAREDGKVDRLTLGLRRMACFVAFKARALTTSVAVPITAAATASPFGPHAMWEAKRVSRSFLPLKVKWKSPNGMLLKLHSRSTPPH